MSTHLFVFQLGPGLVLLDFEQLLIGRGTIIQCVTPVEPLLQHVTHTIYYQSNVLPLIPKIILTRMLPVPKGGLAHFLSRGLITGSRLLVVQFQEVSDGLVLFLGELENAPV